MVDNEYHSFLINNFKPTILIVFDVVLYLFL